MDDFFKVMFVVVAGLVILLGLNACTGGGGDVVTVGGTIAVVDCARDNSQTACQADDTFNEVLDSAVNGAAPYIDLANSAWNKAADSVVGDGSSSWEPSWITHTK